MESQSATYLTNLFDSFAAAVEQPTFLLYILGTYLITIYVVGPYYMKNRRAYQLKTFMVFYNISQVLACICIITRIFKLTSLNIFHFWKCDIAVDNPNAIDVYRSITNFTLWLKIVELSETVVFVLRKKPNQISKLHVFHHCSTFIMVYYIPRKYSGLTALHPLLLNCFVHVIMYTYYLAAAVCDKKTLRQLQPIKKSITIIQMVQFVMILLQAALMFYYCEMPRLVLCIYFLIITVIFYGFYDFYKKAYTPAAQQTKANKIS